VAGSNTSPPVAADRSGRTRAKGGRNPIVHTSLPDCDLAAGFGGNPPAGRNTARRADSQDLTDNAQKCPKEVADTLIRHRRVEPGK
jgi:hypothetical protein